MNIPIVVAGLLLGLSSPSHAASTWEWHGSASAIDVDLVRADVRIVATRGATSVSIQPGGKDAAAATFSASPAEGVVSIRDRYPPGVRGGGECLPPVDERGDYWTYSVPLKVVIAVPPGTRLRLRVISGNVRAAFTSSRFDLETRDGTISTRP